MRDSEGEEEAKSKRRERPLLRRPPAAGEGRPLTARIASPGCGRGDPGRRPGWPTGTNRPRGTDPGATGSLAWAVRRGAYVLTCGALGRQVSAAVRRRPRRPLVFVVGAMGSSCRARVRVRLVTRQ
jgi:hypothetical protein